MLRSINAFSRARDNAAENYSGLLDNLLPSPSDTVVDIIPERLSELAHLKNIEQFRQLGGVPGVASFLRTNAEKGIPGDDEDIIRRRLDFGSNAVQKPTPRVWHTVFEAFSDPIIIILLICATLSLCFGIASHGLRGWSDGGSILVAVFLSSMTAGRESIEINESCNPFFLSGTKVINGSARMLVTAVGLNTERGRMLSSKDYDIEQRTPLQRKLHELTIQIAKVGLMVASLVLVTKIHEVCNTVVGILATPAAIAATAIPEGLLLAVMITIAYSTKRMASQKAIVRNLSACEAVGSTTVICTDERGSLTLNHLIISEFFRANCAVHRPESFNSENTQSSIWIKRNASDTIHVHQKGQPEIILAMCSQYYDEDGIVKHMSIDAKKNLEQIFQEMKNFDPKLKAENSAFIGCLGLKYPCRPEVQKAVMDCREAEVDIKLVTRKKCGTIRVMARASTLDKLQMVQGLKERGHVVAVTGHSIGDAIVLREANAGLSLEIQGTSQAKENSDIIILDDNFDSVARVLSIMWKNIVGQAVYPIIVLLTIQFKGQSTFNLDPKIKDTMIFNILVLWELFVIFNTKRVEGNFFKGIHKRKMFWGVILAIILLQVLIVELLKELADTKQLSWKQWIICIGIAVLAWPMGWLVERIKYPFSSHL
ncbi:unnamed protein product [Coffea canephora]|uniref:Cation-transporting P-type ATPase N-terminal domain-containing protein n=1 Tax=Coffea canephora TaxID=49390 RepID=A0A068TS97_COFCA|nr:unnamed protein product [Coffea canephora]